MSSRPDAQALAPLVYQLDRVMQGDIAFFRRHTHRRHRLRIASAAEIEHEGLGPAQPGCRWYCTIRCISPTQLHVIRVENRADVDVDIPEAIAAWVFERTLKMEVTL